MATPADGTTTEFLPINEQSTTTPDVTWVVPTDVQPVDSSSPPASSDPTSSLPTGAMTLDQINQASGIGSSTPAPDLSGSGLPSAMDPTNWLSSLGNTISSNAGDLAAGAAGLSAANQQKSENAALANKLATPANALISGGMKDLSNYKDLSPTQQAALQSGVSTGQTLTGEANPLIGIGQTAFGQYGLGQLPAWQQAEIDQKTAQQKALARQSLGANVDSTTLAQMDAQIDQQAEISKGNLLQQNLSTGEQAYQQGTGLQQTGGTDITAAYNNASQDISKNLSDALSQITTGLGPLEDSINIQIQGNTALTGQLQQLYAALAKATSSGGAASGGAASGGGLGSLVSGAKGLVSGAKNLYNSLTGGFTPDPSLTGSNMSFPTAAPLDVTGQLGADASAAAGMSPDAALAASLGQTGADITGGGLSALSDVAAPSADAMLPTGGLTQIGDTSAAAADTTGALASSAWALPAAAFGAMAYDSGLLSSLGIGADPNRVPVGNPLTGGTILEGQPGYNAVATFQQPNVAAETQSLNSQQWTPEQASANYQDAMMAAYTGTAKPQYQQESYADFVKQYIAQGGDPSKILPQYQQYIPKT